MKCPYCGNLMEQGYMISGTQTLWTYNKHKLFLIPREDEGEFFVSKNRVGGACIEGYLCNTCNKIQIDLSE